jgi:hypothetical protein
MNPQEVGRSVHDVHESLPLDQFLYDCSPAWVTTQQPVKSSLNTAGYRLPGAIVLSVTTLY